jgi:hypothetical protein
MRGISCSPNIDHAKGASHPLPPVNAVTINLKTSKRYVTDSLSFLTTLSVRLPKGRRHGLLYLFSGQLQCQTELLN